MVMTKAIEGHRIAVAGIAVLAVGGLLLAGCAGGDQPAPTTTTPATMTMPTMTYQLPTDEPITSSNPDDLVGWVGQYSFAEIISPANQPPTDTLSYGVTVYQMGSGFFAAMSVVGFGATQSIMATVQGDATEITLYFNSFIGTNPWKKGYKPGDALIKLSRDSKGKITTTWVTMKPQVSANATPTILFTSVTPTPTATPTATSTKKPSSTKSH